MLGIIVDYAVVRIFRPDHLTILKTSCYFVPTQHFDLSFTYCGVTTQKTNFLFILILFFVTVSLSCYA